MQLTLHFPQHDNKNFRSLFCTIFFFFRIIKQTTLLDLCPVLVLQMLTFSYGGLKERRFTLCSGAGSSQAVGTGSLDVALIRPLSDDIYFTSI